MISDDMSISIETKPSAQMAGGISRSREKWLFVLLFCTDAAYRRQSTKQTATMSVVGTNAKCERALNLSAFRGKPEVIGARSERRG